MTDRKPTANATVALVAVSTAIVVVALIIGVIAFLVANADHDDAPGDAADPDTGLPMLPPSRPAPPPNTGMLPEVTTPPPAAVSCQYHRSGAAAKPVTAPRSGEVATEPATREATLTTDQGRIKLSLDNAKAPCTVHSFVDLAGQGFFTDTACHRLTTGRGLRVLQCGDPTGDGTGGPGYTFADEYPTDQYAPNDPSRQIPITYPRGTLAMANAGPDTNGSQFFLVYADSQLPPGYTVFGTIDEAGLGVLDTIASAGVRGRGTDGAPATPVTITAVEVD
ncbi:MAG TPA: peptidylprolyl isomerase [Mycolicibacillus parakoreensis]|uniref:Peptidyl-prolyl cis-trans isomerase n=1 Tax=Mycolicibacillus parakoreensis TaxID=1069221 RepID=A0ABY3TWM6_9MYCO|nr:peptidylprolyl isomerase [Mycolicibacillus parakoreensis]ULN51274.1 peptidylprolyl isomerase [Mycolicibacillus parakoreensis]HLS00333.1 peptidylprolyl isomerase [Mycolicibacillus parakoreensis]